jgi:hypothetical protein
MSNTRTCNQCGWVAFGVTREHAEAEVKKFNAYFDTLSKDQQEEFYGGEGSSIQSYERCMLFNGPHTNFRESKPEDCPYGCTLNPIIVEKD